MEPDPVPAEEPEPVHVPITKRAGGGAHGIEPAPLSPTASKSEILVPAEGEAAKPEATPVSKPIDRLHLATVHAAKGGDLGALRKLKSTWKNFISSATGPDRSRAKRELADCLWAIQEVTGRSSDRREALTAYREYVLNAPAGGADPRTVGRMRTLEDVLTDSK
jgi:hypothetical protein